jgi:hypothetical protein
MSLITSNREYLLGRGEIYINLLDANGDPTGEQLLGNCPGFTTGVAITQFKHQSAMVASRVTDFTRNTSTDISSSINCDDISNQALAMFLAGVISSVSQAATPVTGEHVIAHLDREYQLGATAANPIGIRNVTGITVKDATAAATYVLNTDYTVNAANGRVAILSTGGIAEDDDIQFGYTPVAGSKTRIVAGEASTIIGSLRFLPDNASGENRTLFIPEATFSAEGDLTWITEEELAAITITVGVSKKNSTTGLLYIDGEVVA